MAGDIDKLNEIFRVQDENTFQSKPLRSGTGKDSKDGSRPVDKYLYDSQKDGEVVNFTGDEESERDFLPVRQSHESRSGLLGGIMYFIFILCASIILACIMWMGASDALALNKEEFTAEVSLPTSIFTAESVSESGDASTETLAASADVTHADVDYVAAQLKDAGLIQYKWLFKFFCKISHADTKIDPGSYELKSTYDYRALVKNMQSGAGNALTATVTIPEGFTMQQIFTRLEENGVSTYNELMEAAATATYNYDFVADTGAADRLEGFLFPDTYEFYVNMQAASAINKLLDNFYNKFNTDMQTQAANMGMSVTDIVKIASLIEKEAANDDERPIIASVIYNRLSTGTPLGLESSILYIHQDHSGAPTSDMLNEDSPYNLLISAGLPPTPICNPGLASINAALNPADTNYIYFTLDTETGTHRFFDNYNEFAEFAATQNYG